MALKATIYKAEIVISDMDNNYYQTHNLTIAQHPSETEQRMMVRILAYILNARHELTFTQGLSTDNEPDLWHKNLIDEIELWISVGLPDEKQIRKACHQAKQVIIYAYSDKTLIWWEQIKNKLGRFQNLQIINLNNQNIQHLESLVQRSMQLQATIQDGLLWISNEQQHLLIEPKNLLIQQ